jgi:ribosomal-protein-alanine N-acetyltransferase
MNMTLQKELRTPRLLLRHFSSKDVEDLMEYSADPEWARYQCNILPHPYSRRDAETLTAMFSDPASWERGHAGLPSCASGAGLLQVFAVVFESKVVADVVLNQRADDLQNERCELAYSLSRRYWGKGLITEASRAALGWAFPTFSLNRVFATCDPRNVGSWRVLEKLGMRREGHLRNHIVWQGEARDLLYYGVLRSEWKG